MNQQMGYNPYSAQGQLPPMGGAPQGPYGNQNPFGAPQNQGPKTFTIPTWLAWLIGIGFIAFCGWLIWFMYFS